MPAAQGQRPIETDADCLSRAAIRRSPRARATPRCRPISRRCRAGNATSARRLDALIVRTVPEVRKAVKWNSPFYGVEGQGWFLGIHCFTRYIKVAFFRGAALEPLAAGRIRRTRTRAISTFTKARRWTRHSSPTGSSRRRPCPAGCEHLEMTMKGRRWTTGQESPSELIDTQDRGAWRLARRDARPPAGADPARPIRRWSRRWKWRGRAGLGACRHPLHRRDLQGRGEADLRQGRGARRSEGPVQLEPRRQRPPRASMCARARRSTKRRSRALIPRGGGAQYFRRATVVRAELVEARRSTDISLAVRDALRQAQGGRGRFRAGADDPSRTGRACRSAADEGEQVGVDHVGCGGRHAVREARIGLERAVLKQLDRRAAPNRRSATIWSSSPCRTQDRDVDRLQILGEVRLGEGLDAVVVRLGAAHHALPPPIVDHALRRPWRRGG